MEDWEVDQGVCSHEKVGQKRCHGLQIPDQDAADGNEEYLNDADIDFWILDSRFNYKNALKA